MTGARDEQGIGTVHVTVEHLARLEGRARGLGFLPRQPRRSILAGRHASRVRGRGLDFDEIRAYLPGDDLRTMDWKVTLRTGKPSVRAYTEERDRPAIFVVDQRMAMFFGSVKAMKSVVAAELAALGAWMAFHTGDRAGAVVFDDARIVRVAPQRSRTRVHAILGAIATMNGALRADNPAVPNDGQLDAALATVLATTPHDALIVVVSDFAGASARTQALLRQLVAHNDVIAALVFDPLARKTVDHGRLVVSGGMLQVELDLGARTVREPLAATFRGRLEDVAALLARSGVPLMALDTAGDTADQLRRQLGRTRRRAV